MYAHVCRLYSVVLLYFYVYIHACLFLNSFSEFFDRSALKLRLRFVHIYAGIVINGWHAFASSLY